MKTLLELLKSISLLFVILACAGCAPWDGVQHRTLTVLAAASLSSPFAELGKQFEVAHPDVKVRFSFAGSQQLAQQLELGAPADVFASASQSYMDAAVKAQRVAVGASQPFARNRLMVVFPKNNPAGLMVLKDLARPGLKLDFAAREVPAGQYVLDFLDKAAADPAYGSAFKDQVMKNVVSYESNVKAVLTKVSLGEADAGIVYSSDATGDPAAQVGLLEIPTTLNVIAIYPIAPLTDSSDPALAQAFVDFVRSKTGQNVLEKFGFLP